MITKKIAWIGDVPYECKLKKLKHITHKIGSGKTPRGGLSVYSKEGVLFLRSQNVFNDGLFLDEAAYISESLDNAQKNSRLLKGDILFNITGSSLGRACVFNMDCSANVNQHVCIIRSNQDFVYNKYLHYVLISDICKSYIDVCKDGVNRPGITYEQLGDFVVPLYSMDKQKAIVDYLDKKCKQIDDSIYSQKQSIEGLKEYRESFIQNVLTKGLENTNETEPSGVCFIGDIPSDWSVSKIRYVSSKIGSGKTPRGGAEVYLKKGILFLRCQNILDGQVDVSCKTYISKSIDESMQNSRVYSGDVLLNITGGSIGRCAVYLGEEYANVSQHVCIIRPIQQDIDSNYLQYVLSSRIGQNTIAQIRMGTNRDSLNFEQIGNIQVPIPTLKQQREIVEFLADKLLNIDTILNKKSDIVTKLIEYKNSIIYESIINGNTI